MTIFMKLADNKPFGCRTVVGATRPKFLPGSCTYKQLLLLQRPAIRTITQPLKNKLLEVVKVNYSVAV